ncbi:MAG: dynamin family protein [Chloroflexi bacterium]|nr:dynamin family protein [Chloroflexota bacterium]
MNDKALEGPLAATRVRFSRALYELAETLKELEDSREDGRRLQEIASDLEEMFFLIVVIGEYNVGKSTFVNALLGEALLETGITPTTEAIELIRYREEAQRRPQQSPQQPGIRIWAHPHTGGKGVALVDTPGSGSVFRQHEALARSFLHRSDLVLFVLSAKRALAETERLYLELARDYGKKVILVLNQIDLLEPAELEQVRRFIHQQVQELLDLRPLLFAVSAGKALAGKKEPGLDALRAHLRASLNEVSPARQKQLAQMETAQRTLMEAQASVQRRLESLRQDRGEAEGVQQELRENADELEQNLQRTLQEIEQAIAALGRRSQEFIDRELAFRPFRRAPRYGKLQETFAQEVLGETLVEIRKTAERYLNRLVDHNRAYWQEMQERLRSMLEVLGKESHLDAALYAEQREDLQQAIRHAERQEKHYADGALVAEMQLQFSQNLTRLRYGALAGLSGWLSLALAFLAPGPLVGVAAAPLALPAAIIGAPLAAVGSVYAWRHLRRIRKESQRELQEASAALLRVYRESLTQLCQTERRRLLQNGEELLRPLFARLTGQEESLEQQAARLAAHRNELAEIQLELSPVSEH